MLTRFKIAALFVCLLAVAPVPAFAQDQPGVPAPPKTYVVSADQLTSGQVASLEAEQQIKTIEVVGKYAGVGKEIGEGVSGALGALNDEAQKFGDTKVGHFTMAMIAWKIMGDDIMAVSHDLIGYVVGVPFMLLSCIALLWSYRRRCIPYTICVEKGAGFFGERKFQLIEPSHQPNGWNAHEWALAHGVMFGAIIVVGIWIIFA